jgi:GNAT superfamily N-acetyltransferase
MASSQVFPHVTEFEVHAIYPDRLDLVRQLFHEHRATRHCWCMAFCSTNWDYADGWFGGNQQRFEELAASESSPMGIVAMDDDEPIGWCSCGPRMRYTAAIAGRSRPLAERARSEDEDVWLTACFFVRPDHRGAGVPRSLLQGAVGLAWSKRASAVEAWPLAQGARRGHDSHVGREELFADLGFQRVHPLGSDRVFMRLDLVPPNQEY